MRDSRYFDLRHQEQATILTLQSPDGTNRLTGDCVVALTGAIAALVPTKRPLFITGNARFFSAGADLREISGLNATSAFEFSRMGQRLMNAIEAFPAPVFAAISGFCMGGGLDLALACHSRIAAQNAVFGHRGAALGLLTGWGGTQRLSRLVGRASTLELLAAAERPAASDAVRLGLVEAVATDPVGEALRRLTSSAVT